MPHASVAQELLQESTKRIAIQLGKVHRSCKQRQFLRESTKGEYQWERSILNAEMIVHKHYYLNILQLL